MFTETTFTLQEAPHASHMTILRDSEAVPQALIFYLHGGGLLYGLRTDLPMLHRQRLTEAGYIIAALDYPLAPAADLPMILHSLAEDIVHVLTYPAAFSLPEHLPFFLWGRSSGAYLSLLLCSMTPRMIPIPRGVISYYGYGFLTEGWADTPSSYYCSLPLVTADCLAALPSQIHTEGPLETHYSSYVYARQSGHWISLFYRGDDRGFRNAYTLRSVEQLPCPLFCTHAVEDPDVPFAEFQTMINRYHPDKYIASGDVHDFDRKDTSFQTKKLLTLTLKFLNQQCSIGDSL